MEASKGAAVTGERKAVPRIGLRSAQGWRRAAEADYAAAGDDAKAILQAFADGVNAYRDTHASNLPMAWKRPELGRTSEGGGAEGPNGPEGSRAGSEGAGRER